VRTLRKWKGGLAFAVLSFAVGTVRLLATGATDRLTWLWFVLAAIYAFTALVARRLVFPERPQHWLGRLQRTPTIARLLHQHGALSDGPATASETGVARHVRHLQQGSEEMVTRNRIANALATIAAIVGMVLVFTGAGSGQKGDDDDNAPSAPTPPSQTAPAVPGQSQPGAPAQTAPTGPQQSQPAAPAPSKKDNDGDDDG
jgi:hypothetical protein